jgi:hypothetical protein
MRKRTWPSTAARERASGSAPQPSRSVPWSQAPLRLVRVWLRRHQVARARGWSSPPPAGHNLTQATLATAETAGEVFAAKVGCTSQSAACLRALPVSTIVDNEDFAGYKPDIDGTVLASTAAAFLIRDAGLPGENIHILRRWTCRAARCAFTQEDGDAEGTPGVS